jgi:hypothetical protein
MTRPNTSRRPRKVSDHRLARLEDMPLWRLERLIESGILGKLQPVAEAVLRRRKGAS